MVRTGARLHFGLLAIDPPHGRQFGGAGLMVDAPGFELVAVPSDQDRVTGGSPAIQQRIRHFLERLRASSPQPRPALEIAIQAEIPSHCGFGSGTQLGLAVATVATAFDDAMPSVRERAEFVGRGKRSAIGMYGFQLGGWLVDGGQKSARAISPLITRLEWPGDWPWVLIAPPEREGLSGVEEQHAFQRLSSMPESMTAKLCRTLLLDLLPGIVDHDFAAVSESLWDYGKTVGEYFLPVQQGLFADVRMARLADQLRRDGFAGIAQTSWGPTIAVMCSSATDADQLVSHLRGHGPWSDCRVQHVQARNRGADVVVE
ncbi:MAG TPA: beta-ribofuranosylaminobenzene 5'-phosphate synthase family protein [Planctomycetaceae bacterium]|nr:beta-ribofuranosylaminobenzene 5'-phosphate synthase family protein [Planctomycetaceae bacterium]